MGSCKKGFVNMILGSGEGEEETGSEAGRRALGRIVTQNVVKMLTEY
jgi:hypothetical protein